MKVAGKVIWITGASSGIGRALALELASRKTRLILSARNTDKLEAVAQEVEAKGSEAMVLPIDLSKSEAISQKVHEVIERFGRIDILVNNGGISQRSLVIDTPIEVDRKIFEINFFGTVALTKAVLPHMINSGGGHIVAISSITGKFGFPLRSGYSSTKHALHGFFGSLRAELKEKGINVTIVCPGRVQTDISLSAITKDGEAHGVMDHGQNEGISAEKCAKGIVNAIEKNKRELLIGGKEILMVYIHKYFPSLFDKIVTRIRHT